jgi:hypothetical protein
MLETTLLQMLQVETGAATHVQDVCLGVVGFENPENPVKDDFTPPHVPPVSGFDAVNLRVEFFIHQQVR